MKNTRQLQQKLFTTIVILIIARLGIFVPIPGVDHNAFDSSVRNNEIINFLNIFSGGGFSTIGIFALGIVPYINASLIIQTLINIIPELKNLHKEEGIIGRQKITQLTRYITLIWSILQSVGIAFWIKPYVFNWNNYFITDCIITLTTGSIISMWFSEIINEYGIGNGASLLIFQNIVSSIPKIMIQYMNNLYTKEQLFNFSLVFILFVIIIMGTIIIQEGKRRIIILSVRQLGKIKKENPQHHIPLKLNQGGIMPLVFASATLPLPSYISQIIPNTIIKKVCSLFLPNTFLYLPCLCLLIILFSYIYSSLILNPEDIGNNLKKIGASIPNIRPGIDTTSYLNKILNKLTFLGSIFLFTLGILPSTISQIANINSFKGLGITSLIILVSVSIDTAKQIQTYIISQKYDSMI
uniref:Protein translocase subunit SecY n=1 Tax=Dicranema revolutum TaxID=239144 RepID=A0A4D6WRR3_9FLOR|nr:SecY-type transporter protein [Dicranema revolutum]